MLAEPAFLKSMRAMPLTTSFRETVQMRARRDIEFQQALLVEVCSASSVCCSEKPEFASRSARSEEMVSC